MKLHRPFVSHLLAPAFLVLLPASASAQSAEEIMWTSLARQEERMGGIDSFTVVQETLGLETTLTYKRSEVEGHTVFLPATADSANAGWAKFYRAYPTIAERAQVNGTEVVDGHPCWVVVVDDLSDLDLGSDMGQLGSFAPKKGSFYFDTDDYLVRRMYLEGEITKAGQVSPMSAETLLTDYRDDGGFPWPYSTQVTAEGVGEQLAEAQKTLAQMEETLAGMDPSQRAMMEKMMGPQIAKLRESVAGGQFKITVITKEVRVYE